MSDHRWSRRMFLKTSALASLPLAVPVGGAARDLESSRQPSGPRGVPMTATEFATRLRGPLVSIPTPFDRDLRIDTAGLGRMVHRALDDGITQFTLTAGDSQFASLTYDEIRQLTRALVELVGTRGIVIAATADWWTSRTVDFARYAQSIGAAALQVMRPGRTDDDGTVAHYADIAAATRLPLVLQGDYSIPLLERLLANESIAAMKEDVDLPYLIDTTVRFSGRLNCFAGGSLQWFLAGQPYGATAYYDAYATFAPEVSRRFWRAVHAGDHAEQAKIVVQYDVPFIRAITAPFWRATLEYFGVAGRYLRPPQRTYTDTQMQEVERFYDALGLHPRAERAAPPRAR